MKGSYLWNTGNSITDLRLIVEGAVTLFEEDASSIGKHMMDAGELFAAAAFDTIGAALYSMRTHIREMQEAHTQEVVRSVAEEIAETKTCVKLYNRRRAGSPSKRAKFRKQNR